jgi:hypothetical protein
MEAIWKGLTCRWNGCAFTPVTAHSTTVAGLSSSRYVLAPEKVCPLICGAGPSEMVALEVTAAAEPVRSAR